MTDKNAKMFGAVESALLLKFADAEQPPTKEAIEDMAIKFAPLYDVQPSDLNEIIRIVQSKLVHTMDKGVSLTDKDSPHDEDWYCKPGTDITWNYWNDYRQLLIMERWSPKIVNTMGYVTDKILGLLKDPNDSKSQDRRGLVIGHVQSGKTANYIGLVSKAADAGYKFIIIIAGIHNNLRKQTQERVDAGFVGRDSKSRSFAGVGTVNRSRAFPITLTNTTSDFSRQQASTFTADLKGFSRPVVVVIKKNVTTLANLHSWLKDLNTENQDDKISDVPMLMIDDEADNASINTNKPNIDPTRTNREIRKILSLFPKGCYVGYTATPFANIFINPDSEEEMIGDDLFPRDFIYCLDAPTNYFGSQKVFIDEESSDRIIRTISDAEEYLPLKHKRNIEVSDIPDTMKEAIKTFIVGKAIRLTRNQGNKHCSMMINVSRFVDVQKQIREHISHYLNIYVPIVKFNYAKNEDACLKDPYMCELKKIFDTEYSGSGVKWHNVQKRLFESIESIKTYVINSKSDEALDYKKYEDAGDTLTALVVGGLSLSRGLTIEGLMVSYMYRNTRMYDTLMQMGRWFGYRPDYADLCRVYLSEESRGWYVHIAEATDELVQLVKQMRRDGRSPKQFGLYVRAHPDALYVTALNKMRNAESRIFSVNYDGKLRETYILPDDDVITKNNIEAMKIFYSTLKNKHKKPSSNKLRNLDRAEFWSDIGWEEVAEFIMDFQYHSQLRSEKDSLLAYMRKVADTYPVWDIGFISLAGTGPSIEGLPMALQTRQVGVKKPSFGENGWYVGNKQKVSGKGVEITGLDEKQYNKALEYANDNGRDKPDDHDYRQKDVRGKPFLMLHLLELFNKDEKLETRETLASNIPAIGLSFPATGDTRSVEYVVNKVWINQDSVDSPDEDDDYDE